MRSFLFLTGLLFSGYMMAQAPAIADPLVLSNISEQNGLSDDHVQCVIKDREGLVWIGTSDGLNLMDGSTIKVFKHIDQDSNSLINNDIFCLREDGQGNIWMGTANGISCYRKNKHLFYSVLPPLSPYGAASAVNAVVIDKQQRIWWGTDGGLLLFDPLAKKFTPFYILHTAEQSNITLSNKLHYIMEDGQNYLWICSSDGVWSFDLSTFQFKKEIHRNNDPQYNGLFLYVFEDHNKKIWAGNWQYGLKQLERNTGHVINYTSLPGHPALVSCINEIRQPNGKYILWLNGNLLTFDPGTDKFFQYPKPTQYADYPDVSPSFRSADNWLWMISRGKGLYIYNPQLQLFQHNYFSRELTSQEIVFTEWNDWLLAGAQGESFLKAYDRNWNIKKDYAVVLDLPTARQHGAALCFAKENENDLWAGTSEGIVNINLLTGKHRWFVHQDNDTSLPRNFITHLFFDSKKQFWVFPWREGIWTMDTQTGKCKRLWEGFIPEADHLKRLLIADAVEDREGNIWMADLDEGIILYDQKKKIFSKPFVKEIGERTHASRIFFQNGFCYSNTSFSIIKWDPVNPRLQRFTPPAEIGKELYDITPDREGNWWLATRNGLIVFNEKNNSFKRYTTTDGLLNNDMNGTLFCRQDGSMLFGTNGYFTSFDPKKLSASSQGLGPILLRTVLVNEKPVDPVILKPLNLDYRSSNIEFQWALPDYTSPFKNQYYCRLEGIDSTWRYVGNKGEIQYASLAAGHYTVFLKATTSNGTEANNIIQVDFTIHPPFWKTTGFISLLSVILLSGFVIIVRYISQRNLKEKLLRLEKEQAIEKERNRISRDMHDDLGSGLTKIAILSEVVKKQIHEPEKAKQQLENISASSRELVDNLQDIIWVLNPKNDTLESLAAYIREYGLKFFEPFGIDIRFHYPEKFTGIKLSEETRRNIFLVVKESFNNTVKHAWCDKADITIQQESSRITIIIKDDGKGFDINKVRSGGNGLINMQVRLEQIGGTYRIESAPGAGTATTLALPI